MNPDIKIALDPSTDPRKLFELSRHPDWRVRRHVARHSNTSPAALAALASDPHLNVRFWVVVNCNTPIEALVRIASSDPQKDIRSMALKRITVLDLFA